MHHALLVARLVIGQRAGVVQLGLEQRLADARDVAVPEDAEAAFDEPVLDTVTLAALGSEESHDGLADRETDRAHAFPPGDE